MEKVIEKLSGLLNQSKEIMKLSEAYLSEALNVQEFDDNPQAKAKVMELITEVKQGKVRVEDVNTMVNNIVNDI